MPEQLRMVWPRGEDPQVEDLPPGYRLRQFVPGDEKAYIELLNCGELGSWNEERLQSILENLLSPGGIHFVVHEGKPVATACGLDRTGSMGDSVRRKAELGWVAVSPEHCGQGLGRAVSAAVVRFLLALDYDHIFLKTDEWRLPAVKTYLRLGFEPVRTTPDARFRWSRLADQLEWMIKTPTTARHRKGPTGEEIAWRTLEKEKVTEPCILGTFVMKREFFQKLTQKKDIYSEPAQTVIEAFIKARSNLCVQFIMPSPETEHIACDPLTVHEKKNHSQVKAKKRSVTSPEDIRQVIEELPDPDSLKRSFDLEGEAEGYARRLLRLRDIARGEMLFIGGFGQADFMGGYTRWGYGHYLTALKLYPDHLRRYYRYTAARGRLSNMAIVRAVEKYNLAPFVYGGQDICFNEGPVCSPELLDEIYFPALRWAVEPLHNAGIGIIWHCDGDVRPILEPLISEVGVSGFQGFQEETGCTLDTMAGTRTRDGEKPVIIGSVSVTTTLPYGSREDVEKDVERCFRTAAPGGGFCLGPTSSVLPETPLENILAMQEHGFQFGREYLQEIHS